MDANLISDQLVSQLLSLIRASLWQKPVESGTFSKSEVDWNLIGTLSSQQTVVILVIRGALSLPEDLMPPKEWLHKAYSVVERNLRTHLLLNESVATATRELNRSGIRSVLLKGQAYSLYYPDPNLRQCGDIDMYVGSTYYREAYETAHRSGWDCKESFSPESKHYGCFIGRVRLELHKQASVLPFLNADRKFQKWSQTELTQSVNYAVIGGEKVILPSALFDVVFVFLHLYLHFLRSGIGLRQLCDWVMILHSHRNRINRQQLEALLKELHLMQVWRIFSPIAVDYLGLPESEMPFYSPKYEKKAKKVLSLILTEGNFGKYALNRGERPENYMLGKLFSLRSQTRILISRLSISPSHVAISFLKMITVGIKAVLMDII